MKPLHPTKDSDVRPQPILELARQWEIPAEFLSPYGHFCAKLDPALLRTSEKPKGKLVLVSSITPTPAGEGKTVTTIGLSQGINRLGKRAIAAIRQPSMGPVFGAKGGAAGGGKAQVIPMEKVNLHLTGDFHAVSAAHNLAAAALDARLYHEQRLQQRFSEQTDLPLLNINAERILWPRCVDHNDRALRRVTLGVGGGLNGVERAGHFEITAASELMAILALSESLQDMRQRIGRIILAYNQSGEPITTEQLGVAGAMTAIMKECIQPTLMQTAEQTPALLHAGPFANIAHGNSSIIADRIGLQLADYVVTEAGFGSDMGMEKFFNIKYRQSGIAPSCVVLVATLRSLKAHSGRFNIKPGQALPLEITQYNPELLQLGSENLKWHIQNARRYQLPVIVAINRFPQDDDRELKFLQEFALQSGAVAAEISEGFAKGSDGTEALAKRVLQACEGAHEGEIPLLYPDSLPLTEKLQLLVKEGYHATGADLTEQATQDIRSIEKLGLGHLPLCMAKTPLSISADPALKNVPKGFSIPVTRLEVSAGAGFIRVYAGNIMTMPGLGSHPSYLNIDVDNEGKIVGLD